MTFSKTPLYGMRYIQQYSTARTPAVACRASAGAVDFKGKLVVKNLKCPS